MSCNALARVDGTIAPPAALIRAPARRAEPAGSEPGIGAGIGAPVDFAVIGAMRAGTTLLHDILSRHPAIGMARMKETDYFIPSRNHARGPEWYRGQFRPDCRIRGDVSPNYTKARDFPGVPELMARIVPGIRLVYLVRDPVRRAMSQYRHSWLMGGIRETPVEIAGTPEYVSILEASCYARQLDGYLRHFRQDQILVVDLDDLLSAPQPALDRILAHVGAAPMAVPDLGSLNRSDELARVPGPLLRLAHGPLRPVLTAALGGRARGQLRRMLAWGPRRAPPEFPAALEERMRDELAGDAARLRRMTGQGFARWSV